MKGPEFLQDAFAEIDDALLADAITAKNRPIQRRPFASFVAAAAAFLLLVSAVLPFALGLLNQISKDTEHYRHPAFAPDGTLGNDGTLGGNYGTVTLPDPFEYGNNKLYDVSSPVYSTNPNASFSAHYDALCNPVVLIEGGISKQISFDLFGEQLTLRYVESLYYVCGDYTVRRYRIEGARASAYIDLLGGNIYRMSYYSFSLPLSGEGTVREQLELALSERFDFSRFTEFSQVGDRYTWSRTVDGYGVDDAFQVVYENGEVKMIYNRPQLFIRQTTLTLEEIETVVGEHMRAVYENESDKELESYAISKIYYGWLEDDTVLYVEVSHTYKTEHGVSDGRTVRLIILD